MRKIIRAVLRNYFPRLLIGYRLLRSEYRNTSAISRNPLGFNFAGNASMASGLFEPGETKVFIDVLRKVDVVINIGANVGYYCCIALSHNKKVVAFEPVPSNVKALLRNIKANQWESRIEVFPMALSNTVGVIDIYGGGTGASLIKGWADAIDTDSSLVPCSTLDTVLQGRFSDSRCLLMVDIEGAEKLMLEGANSFLDMHPKPIWFMEISVRANQPGGVSINPDLLATFEKFWSRGYVAWTTHNQNRVVTRSEVQEIASGGKDTIHGDTFLFIDEEVHGKFESFI